MEVDNDFRLRESDWIKNGNQLVTFDIDGIKVGLGIGYDLSFSELATLYRKNGVEMMIYPSVYPTTLGQMHWEQLVRTRAIDNQVYVLGVSQARDDNNYDLIQNGRSMLVDFRGRVVVRAGDDEEILYGECDFTDLDKFRNQIQLFTHKRTDIYDTINKM